MKTTYNGVKFYSKYDMSCGRQLQKAESVLEEFKENDGGDINYVLQLYNIQRFFDAGIEMPEWGQDKLVEYSGKCKTFTPIMARTFSEIEDSNLEEVLSNVSIDYIDDFLELFVKFKCYQKISGGRIKQVLADDWVLLRQILSEKILVKQYGNEIAEILRNSDQTAEWLVECYLEEDSKPEIYQTAP